VGGGGAASGQVLPIKYRGSTISEIVGIEYPRAGAGVRFAGINCRPNRRN